MSDIRSGWLIDDNDDKFAPKTFIRQVLTDDGRSNLHAELDSKAKSSDLSTVALSGNYNDLINKPCLNFKDKNLILIGDSYGEGAGLTNGGWCKRFADMYGGEVTRLYYNPQSSAGFFRVSEGGQQTNFEGCLRNLVTQEACKQYIPENERPLITDIVVLGGFNDGGADYNELELSIKSFINYAISVFPNAMIRIGMIGWDAHNSTFNTLFNDISLRAYSQYYNKNTYLYGMEYVCHDISQFQWDDIHPTDEAVNRIVRALAQSLMTGQITENRYSEVTYNSDVRELLDGVWGEVCGVTSGTIVSYISNDNTIVKSTELVINFNDGHNRYFGNNMPIKLADLTGGYIVGSAYCYIPIHAVIQYTDNDIYKFRECMASLYFNDGRMYIYIEALNDDNTNFLYCNLNNIYIRPFSFNIDSMRQV